MSIRITALFFLLASLATGQSQQQLLHCGADEMRIQTLSANPGLAPFIQIRQDELNQFTDQFATQPQTRGQVYIIPVVFHIIHQNGAENISDAQIHDAVNVVNLNYRHLKPDTTTIVTQFKPIAADCEIELRLAQLDPNGNCHSGINRIVSPLTTTGDHQVKSLIQWDPSKYLNVYVVANAAGLAGHAVWPSDADTIPEWDGIVITHSYVGSIGTSDAVRSVVLSHELGHYLNLEHIWGGNNVPGFYYLPVAQAGNCAFDDGVTDTPNTIGWSVCNLSGASCGNLVDNVQNFMDYAYCARMFTQGQATRMRACLNSSIAHRDSLWQNSNLVATGTDGTNHLCAASFTVDKQIICAGQSIVLTDNSYHGVTTRSWTVTGGTAGSLTDSVITVTYNTPGIYNVSLMAGDGSSTVSLTKNNYITVTANTGSAGPLLEAFESIVSIPDNTWLVSDPQEDGTFELSAAAGYSGTHSVFIDNYSSSGGTLDELILAPLDVSSFPTVQVSFRYAFAIKDSADVPSDILKVFVSNDCGISWSQRKTLNVSLLQTVSPQLTPFTPAGFGDWSQATITNIPAQYLTDNFMLKFTFNGNGGNNLYLDDINIAANIGIDESEMFSSLMIVPNPAGENAEIRFNSTNAGDFEIVVTDISGRVVLDFGKNTFYTGQNNIQIPLGSLQNGVYCVTIKSENSELSTRLIRF